MHEESNKRRFIRLPEVKKLTGLSRSTIYVRMANGDFPGLSNSEAALLRGSNLISPNGLRIASQIVPPLPSPAL